MGIKAKPQLYIHSCDRCGHSITQNADRLAPHWARVRITIGMMPYHGYPSTPAEDEVLLCQSCVNAPLTESPIYRAASEKNAERSAQQGNITEDWFRNRPQDRTDGADQAQRLVPRQVDDTPRHDPNGLSDRNRVVSRQTNIDTRSQSEREDS